MLAIDGLELEVETQSPAARRLRVALPRHAPAEEISRLERILTAFPGIIEVRPDGRTRRALVRYAPEAALPIVEGRRARSSSLRSALEAVRVGPLPSPVRATPSGDAQPWHALDLREVLERLGSGERGLDDLEALRRLRRVGPNVYEATESRSWLEIFVAQLGNLPTALLLGSSLVSAALGDLVDAAAIDAVVALNAGIGYRIEKTSEELIDSWRRLEAGAARVVRAGAIRTIPAIDLVPGDVIACRAGDVLPADARVLEAQRLTSNEALLTGESEPQRKWPDSVAPDAALAERTSMLYAGTPVVSGRGRAVVVATGAGTEMARVRSLIEQERAPRAPLERRMEELGRQGTWLSLVAGGLAAAGGITRGQSTSKVLRNAIALAVAAIPEGLPVVVTAALVRSMARMRSQGMVVRRVAAAETLGGVTIVCADKTGTLTEGEMRLELFDIDGERHEPSRVRASSDRLPADRPALALIAALLNSDVEVREGARGLGLVGSSTERAFVAAAREAGLDLRALRAAFPRSLLLERSETAHYVISLHHVEDGGAVAFVKGAPDQILSLCASDGDEALDLEARRRVMERNDALAAKGLRVLALAWQRLEAHPAAAPAGGYSFIGLAALSDPVRAGAAEAVRRAERAGIRAVVVTGDQRATAAAVAREVGLPGECRDGAEVASLTEASPAASSALARTSVLSRVTPAHKLRIVKAFRERGEIIAMVGDGINDAPAMKAADIGIAVGPDAADVARQTADVVLTNDDLRSILSAVGEGRIVQDNLRRATGYLFATNLSEVSLVVASAFLAQVPLSPLQLLWINLLTDTLPALAIALDPGQPDVLDRPPAPPDAPIIRPGEWTRLGRHGLLMAALGEAAYLVGGQGAAFAALPAAQLAYSAVCRARGPGRDGFGWLVGGAAALHLAAISLPPLRAILKVPAPSPASILAYGVGLALPLGAAFLGSDEIVAKSATQRAVPQEV